MAKTEYELHFLEKEQPAEPSLFPHALTAPPRPTLTNCVIHLSRIYTGVPPIRKSVAQLIFTLDLKREVMPGSLSLVIDNEIVEAQVEAALAEDVSKVPDRIRKAVLAFLPRLILIVPGESIRAKMFRLPGTLPQDQLHDTAGLKSRLTTEWCAMREFDETPLPQDRRVPAAIHA